MDDELTEEDSPEAAAVDTSRPTPVVPDAIEMPKERYTTRHELGHGGMGEVMLVHDHVIGREVALKHLRKETATGRRRFAREARVQGQLEHPAIVPVYDFGTSPDGAPYFTMKRVRGVSLKSVLTALGSGESGSIRFSRRRVLTAFSQVCLAVHYAHERGVVHRDIKPDNIMLGDYGEVYLLDWGIAKVGGTDPEKSGELGGELDETHTREGAVMGTVAYMAPEQARGAAIDSRTDIYALGAILFEILAFKRLHESAPLAFMLDRIVEGIDARPSVRAPHLDVPPELEAVCVAATRREPAERLQTARALHEAIESFLDGDRDLQLRLANAVKHATSAQRAAARAFDAAAPASEEPQRRAEALREVGKALALDPDNQEALRTLVHLLTTPPRTIPAEVARGQQWTWRQQIRRAAALGGFMYTYTLLNIFIVYQGAIKDWRAFLPAQAFWLGTLAASIGTALRPSYAGLFAMLGLAAIATVMSTPILSPILIVPTILAAHAVLYCLMHGWRRRIGVLAITCGAWFVTILGDRFGLFPRTVEYLDGGLLIRSPIVDLSRVFSNTHSGFAYLALIVLPAILVGAMRSSYFKADLQMRLQTWQLKQLVPDEAAETMQPIG